MTDSDSLYQRQIAHVYAGMAEAELRKLAEEAWSLTEVGKDALKVELARRGLAVDLAEASTTPLEANNLVILRQFRDLPEALLAKGALESADIRCLLADDIAIRMDWLWSNALGGIKLCVKSEDAAVAAQLLDQAIPESFEVTGEGEYKQPHCPNCQSLDISFERDLYKPVVVAGMFLGLPILVGHRRWECRSCGHIWQESEPQMEDRPLDQT